MYLKDVIILIIYSTKNQKVYYHKNQLFEKLLLFFSPFVNFTNFKIKYTFTKFSICFHETPTYFIDRFSLACLNLLPNCFLDCPLEETIAHSK